MIPKPARANFYVLGGAVPRDAPSYVMRDADLDLHSALTRGEFCYVLTSRQMGKSSLMMRTITRLREERVKALFVDLQSLGANLTPEQWYLGLLDRVGSQLELEDEVEAYWYANPSHGPLQRWLGAIREVVMARTQEPVCIFIDEIDYTRALPFSADEFFAGIRGLYTERLQTPALNRLSFCLLGVATPIDLIQDPRTTPFNIGHRVELTDFTTQEAQVLLPGLSRAGRYAPQLLIRILYWTGGHPYLTQRLCQAVMEDQRVRSPGGVDRVCAEIFFTSKARESDTNLLFVRDRMLRGGDKNPVDLLTTYLNIWTGRMEKDDPANALLNELRLAGIVRSESGYLRVRNRIYQRVFDQKFVEDNQPQDEVARQRKAEKRGRMKVLVWASALVGAFGALAITAWTSRQEAIEKNNEYTFTANAGMKAMSSVDDTMSQLSAKHPELGSSYTEINAAAETFLDGMLKIDPKNPAANDLKANALSAAIAEDVRKQDKAAARTKAQECLSRAEDLKNSRDTRLRAIAARLYATAAQARGKLGDSAQAEESVKKAEQLVREVASNAKPGDEFTLTNLSATWAMIGDAEAAMDHWERAAESYQRTISVNQKVMDLSPRQSGGGRNFQLVRDSLETRNREARMDYENHKYDEARKVLQERSLAIAQTLVQWNQDPASNRSAGDQEQARADLRDVKMELGNVLAVSRTSWAEALKYYDEALSEAQQLAQESPNPANTEKQEEAALAVARVRKLLGQKEAALGAYNKYIAMLRERDSSHPSKETTEKLGFAYHELAAFEAHHGTKSAAPADFQNAIEWLAKVAPGDPAAQRKLAGAQLKLADVQSDFGQSDQARDNYSKAVRTSEKCITSDQQRRGGQEDEDESALLVDYENLAFGRLGVGDRKGALDAIAKLLDSAKAEVSTAKASLDAKRTSATVDHAAYAYNILGWAELLNNHPQESIQALQSVPQESRKQAWIQANLAHAYLLSGQFDQARSVYLEHIGEQMYDDRFEISVLDDLAELRKLGFDPPAIEKIEKLLAR